MAVEEEKWRAENAKTDGYSALGTEALVLNESDSGTKREVNKTNLSALFPLISFKSLDRIYELSLWVWKEKKNNRWEGSSKRLKAIEP